MNVAEMRMLRWMSEVTRDYRIRDEYVRGSIGVASIEDKIRENRLGWFGHDEVRGNKNSKSGYENEC
jgi:hypothetical protein